MAKLFVLLGSLCAALAVILGAFGAHALKSSLSADMLEVYQTGVQYHFYHALGLLLIGVIAVVMPQNVLLKWAGFVMIAGIVLFSGSLYALALTGVKALGAITPVGGLCFIAAWLLVAGTALRQ
jgi:uncharacterized membrane protein YgdD (TMEM256/DUF423 family)